MTGIDLAHLHLSRAIFYKIYRMWLFRRHIAHMRPTPVAQQSPFFCHHCKVVAVVMSNAMVMANVECCGSESNEVVSSSSYV